MKLRLDKLVVERGLAASRERAQSLILAGRMLVNEQRVDKPGTAVAEDANLRLLGEDLRYVSRGGLKLEHALQHWSIALEGVSCIDIGTSTGGFTDCMLQHGAARVLCIDTGYGQIAQKLRDDPRVSLQERKNARFLQADDLSLYTSVQPTGFFSMDVSFISATLVLPPVVESILEANRRAGHAEMSLMGVILVKPQFEVGREHVGKGGIVRDPESHKFAVERVKAVVKILNGNRVDILDSPILGTEGNREFLLRSCFLSSSSPSSK